MLGLRPLVAAAAVVLCALLASPAPAQVGDCAPAAAWPASRGAPAAEVVQLVNAHRTALGLPPLAVSPTLTAAAVWKARHMAAYRYFAHDDPAPPVARTPAERMQACGYPVGVVVGENIAAGSPTAQEVVAGWLGSPGHRANIEAAGFAAIGVGSARTADGIDLWVQDFGSLADAGATVPPPPPAPPPPASTAPAAFAVRSAGCRRAKRSRRAVRCRVVVTGPATPAGLQGRLVRRGRTVARGSTLVRAPGATRIRLAGKRRLPAGRYRLVLSLADARGRATVRLGKPR